jgi:hypothetical protein
MIVVPYDSAANRLAVKTFSSGTKSAERTIPWASAAAWQEIQKWLRETIAAYGADLGEALALAERIAHRYALAGDLFDELAATTCNVCRRPCCRNAKVWLDSKDLLLIHLVGQAPPAGQLRPDWRSPCRHLTSRGCALPRAVRPWVCTWYICPDQRRALQRDIPAGQTNLDQWWPEIRALRGRMEAVFVKAVKD